MGDTQSAERETRREVMKKAAYVGARHRDAVCFAGLRIARLRCVPLKDKIK
jgi:hypothetical protein